MVSFRIRAREQILNRERSNQYVSIQARAASARTDTYGTGSIQYCRFENRFLSVCLYLIK